MADFSCCCSFRRSEIGLVLLISHSEKPTDRSMGSSTTQGPPTISVILPAFNAAATIDLAVRSILAQTETDFELLVVDDGSTDSTVEILRGYDDPRLKVFAPGENRGLTVRLNELLEEAQGSYVARMDADDVSYPCRLERQRAELEGRNLDLVGAAIVVVDDQLRPKGIRWTPLTHDEICARPWSGFYFPHPTWFGRRDVIRSLGYRNFRLCEDQELLLRGHRELRLGNVEDVLLGYREPRPSWRKIKRGRRSFVAALRANAGGYDRNPALAVAEQYVKLAFDGFSVTTGLAEKLLAHRHGAPDLIAYAAWDDVLRGLNVEPLGR